jgi:hypothetical protein
VSSSPDRRVQAIVAAKVHGCHHVCDVGALSNHPRSFIDHGVVDRSRLIVIRVAMFDQTTVKGIPEFVDLAVIMHKDLPRLSYPVFCSDSLQNLFDATFKAL